MAESPPRDVTQLRPRLVATRVEPIIVRGPWSVVRGYWLLIPGEWQTANNN
jgi:hypothetical protein